MKSEGEGCSDFAAAQEVAAERVVLEHSRDRFHALLGRFARLTRRLLIPSRDFQRGELCIQLPFDDGHRVRREESQGVGKVGAGTREVTFSAEYAGVLRMPERHVLGPSEPTREVEERVRARLCEGLRTPSACEIALRIEQAEPRAVDVERERAERPALREAPRSGERRVSLVELTC